MAVNFIVPYKRSKIDEKSSMLRHRCLWHISRSRIERLNRENIIHNPVLFIYFDTCIDCLKGELIVKTKNVRANKCDDVYMCEPIILIVMSGYGYSITFINDSLDLVG